jgi:hypothetical protein
VERATTKERRDNEQPNRNNNNTIRRNADSQRNQQHRQSGLDQAGNRPGQITNITTERDETMTNEQRNQEKQTESLFCPQCDTEWTTIADRVENETTRCPKCQTETCVPMLSVDRAEDNEDAKPFGFFATMAEARQAINAELIEACGGDEGEMVLDDEPTDGGFWADSTDNNMWWIERA